MTLKTKQFDIIIIGAGPAGLCFAKALQKTGLDIALIDKNIKESLKNPDYDGRETAITHLSKNILDDLDIWPLIPQEKISLIKAAKVMNGHASYALSFDHKETGADTLGFMISNQQIRKAAYQAASDVKNVTLLDHKEVTHLGRNDEIAWIDLADGTRLEAALIVAADSRFSTTRRMMGISTSMLDFGRTCIVCTMSAEKPHHQTAYECFHYDRTLAVLPLNDNQVSAVITINSDQSDHILTMGKDDFAADIMKRTNYQYGDMALTSELYPYPLVATFAKNFYANRFALIGDAAVGMHPVTAHGFNLGLRGAYTLANEIQKARQDGRDFAAQSVLRAYEQKQRQVALPIYQGTNAIVKLYTKDTPLAKIARRSLLRLGNHIKPAKKMIMNQLTEIEAL